MYKIIAIKNTDSNNETLAEWIKSKGDGFNVSLNKLIETIRQGKSLVEDNYLIPVTLKKLEACLECYQGLKPELSEDGDIKILDDEEHKRKTAYSNTLKETTIKDTQKSSLEEKLKKDGFETTIKEIIQTTKDEPGLEFIINSLVTDREEKIALILDVLLQESKKIDSKIEKIDSEIKKVEQAKLIKVTIVTAFKENAPTEPALVP